MVRVCFILFFVLITSITLSAQANLLNAKNVEEIGKKSVEQIAADNDVPLPYGYVDDRNIMWSKVVWEHIDLSQRINLPYYFPIDNTGVNSNRKSLFDTLMDAIKSGAIKDIYEDSFFTTKLTLEMLDQQMTASVDDGFGGQDVFKITSELVTGFQIKGMWYFDKLQGEMKYRMLALAPMGIDIQAKAGGIDDKTLYPKFWVFFPAVRNVLHASKVFNPKNATHPISYDHLLNARRFSSVIIKEENIFGNRAIKDYVKGNSLFQLLEADKIKEDIRNKEMDMWNY